MELKFDEKGLIPAIVQDHYTKEVLTLAYMNAETLALTIAEGRTVFWSRRQWWKPMPASCSTAHRKRRRSSAFWWPYRTGGRH